MTQEQINKLQELKELLNAGIITEDEMQAEKAKILGTASGEKKVIDESVRPTNKTSKPNEPVKQEDSARKESVTEDEAIGSNKTTRNIILAVACLLTVGAIIFAVSSADKQDDNNIVYDYNETANSSTIDKESVREMETTSSDESSSRDTNNDEFSIDPWSGSLNIEGDIYRMCSTLAYITLSKTGKGMYSGTMELMLGDEDIDLDTHEPTGRFFDDQGHLTGKIRAKADGQTLTIVLDSYTISKPSEFFEDLSKGQQIFRLSYDGTRYSIQAIGKMQTFFDSINIR